MIFPWYSHDIPTISHDIPMFECVFSPTGNPSKGDRLVRDPTVLWRLRFPAAGSVGKHEG